jgi:hypothetical protein
MRLDEVDKQITPSDLEALETFADRIFGKVGIDVEFTRHFLDRVNDERNGKQITASELTRLFKQEYKKWGQPIAKMGPDAEAVMKDLQTDINMPFALRWDNKNKELDLIAKTVMRKQDFKTSNREFEIEGQSEEAEDCSACNGTGWERVSSDEDERGCDECDGTGKIEESVINEESQIWKFNKEDPNNPEVLIQGFGRLMLNQIEDSVIGKLEDLVKRAKGRRDWQQIDSLLGRDVMQIMIKAIVDTKKDLEKTRKRGGPKSRGINKDINYESKERTSILDVVGESKIEEGMFDKLKVASHKKAYERAAERLHEMLQRKYKENKGVWRHALSWYVSRIASSFDNVDSKILYDFYLDNYKSAFITETGGVGKIVPGVNTTIDVGPDEIKKQAAKFGSVVNKDGLPKKTFR